MGEIYSGIQRRVRLWYQWTTAGNGEIIVGWRTGDVADEVAPSPSELMLGVCIEESWQSSELPDLPPFPSAGNDMSVSIIDLTLSLLTQ